LGDMSALQKNNNSLYLDIFSILRVWAPDLPGNIRELFCSQLGRFARETANAPEKPDILFLPIIESPPITKASEQMSDLFGFYIADYQGGKSVVFTHKGRPDFIVVFSEPIQVFYQNRPRLVWRLYGVFLFCLRLALIRKNGLLCHGTIAEREGCSVLFTGHRGIKKTLLLLTMLRHGWDYLSDDKFVLHNGEAHIFQSFLVLRDHHFEALPWLMDVISEHRQFMRWSALRKGLRRFMRSHLPKKLLPVSDKLFNPMLQVEVNSLFPGCKVLTSAKPSVIILLQLGIKFDIIKTSREEIINDMALIQRLAFQESIVLEDMIALYESRIRHDIPGLISRNLESNTFLKVILPGDCNLDLVYGEVERCLGQPS